MDPAFPTSYEDSRARFVRDLERIRVKWPGTKLISHVTKIDSTPSIDYAWAPAKRKEHLIIVSTALHGIEGYVGANMLKIFMEEFAPELNPENTGLLLIHSINPVGMKNFRRYNENNVDLNRNFMWEETFPRETNQDYDALNALLNPAGPLKYLFLSDLAFLMRLIGRILRLGILRIRQGMLSGQYRHARGVQFGGEQTEASTMVVRDLFEKALSEYDQVIHLDMHTGYGPRYQMSMVNSTREQASAENLKRRFNYPLIVAATPSEFYTVTGDITDHLYRLRDERHPSKKVFATCFEFGTFGQSLFAQIRSMRITILENRVHQYGARTDALKNAVTREYGELFFPSEQKWRTKAMKDCRLAMNGIFKDLGLIE